jgi:hypothetical protein
VQADIPFDPFPSDWSLIAADQCFLYQCHNFLLAQHFTRSSQTFCRDALGLQTGQARISPNPTIDLLRAQRLVITINV